MSERLTKGVYGAEFQSHVENTPFGLHCGQMRGIEICHNSGWYNLKGEKLGWGDLNALDLTRISNGLLAGEGFVVLYEGDASCELKRRLPEADEYDPGLEYVMEYAWIVILPGRVYVVSEIPVDAEGFGSLQGMSVQYMRRERMRALIALSGGGV